MLLKFSKMHGTGNDFVVFPDFSDKFHNLGDLAKTLCDRHFGVGADGIIAIKKPAGADFEMAYYNADGSFAEMCGNGVRCVAKYVFDRGHWMKPVVAVLTGDGVKTLEMKVADGIVESVRVDMGAPRLAPAEIPMILPAGGAALDRVVGYPLSVAPGFVPEVTAVSMGNPHCVMFVDNVQTVDIGRLGPMIECHASFPKRVNAEFAQVIRDGEIALRVWERGVGETLACGTGACATGVAARLAKGCGERNVIHVRGGDLVIEWAGGTSDSVFMTGPATFVFDGEIEIGDIGI
jgi:diaminopimelate epimerase